MTARPVAGFDRPYSVALTDSNGTMQFNLRGYKGQSAATYDFAAQKYDDASGRLGLRLSNSNVSQSLNSGFSPGPWSCNNAYCYSNTVNNIATLNCIYSTGPMTTQISNNTYLVRFRLNSFPTSNATVLIYNGHGGLGGQGIVLDNSSKLMYALSGGIVVMWMTSSALTCNAWHSAALRINGSQLWESWFDGVYSNLGYNGTNTPQTATQIFGLQTNTGYGILNGYLADAVFTTTSLTDAQCSNYSTGHLSGGSVFM